MEVIIEMKYISCFIFFLFLLCIPAQAATNEASFTSDTINYDIKTGSFLAEGNVTIKGRGLTIIATHASGDTKSKAFNLSGNVTLNGLWNSDDIKLSAMSATAEMSERPQYTLESGISGSLGKIAVDCDYIQMISNDIFAKGVRKFQDQKAGVTFSASTVKGKIDKGELAQADAEGNIIIRGTPDKKGGIVELRGKKAIYSRDRGTLVVSGGVTATQGKRTFRADSLVYIPATNRIEALGSETNRPHITIELDDEKNPPLPQNN